MAKIEVEVELQEKLKTLSNAASKVPNLGTEGSTKVQQGLEAAKKALDARDWEGFRTQFNRVLKTLTNALAATGSIPAELKKLNDIKGQIEKDLDGLRAKAEAIQGRYTDGQPSKNTLKKTVADQTFADWTAKAGTIHSAGRGHQALGRDTVAERFNELIKYLQENGLKLTQVTNEIAQTFAKNGAGFQSRDDVLRANRYFKYESQRVDQDSSNLAQTQEETKSKQEDLKKVNDELARLAPVSEEAGAGLQKLYQSLVELRGSTNDLVSNKKSDERRLQSGPDVGAAKPVDVDAATKALNKQGSSLGRAFRQFTLYAVAVRMARRALRDAVKTVKDLDKYLTEQAMVTGKTRKETYALLQTYQDMAASLGATTKEVAEVATQFLRQGKTTAEALKLTEAAISAAKIAGIGATDSVNYLTTALNGFQLSAEQAMRVSDRFAAIAAQSATSYEEIATALSKVAAQANMAGMSIDYTTALLAKGIETTREAPETIGTALKTVIARMRELTDYGATLEDGMSINNVEEQLAYIGIKLRDTNGELRSTEDVLNELGAAWDTLSTNQQAAVAKALAGTRQQSRLIAMMTDYDRVIELQQIAERSAGATSAQMATYLEGMEAALNRVNVAWEKIVKTVTDSEAIIGLIHWVSDVLEHIADLFQNQFILISSIVVVSTLLLASLANRYEMQKAQNRAVLQERKTKLETYRTALQEKKAAADLRLQDLMSLKNNKQKLSVALKILAAKKREAGNEAAALKYEAEALAYEKSSVTLEQEIQVAKAEAAAASAELKANSIEIWKTELQIGQNAAGFTSIVTSLLAPIGTIVGFVGTIFSIITAINTARAMGLVLQRKEQSETAKSIALDRIKAAWSMAGSAGKIPYVGWAIALGILAAIGIALAVNAVNASRYENSAEGAADRVNDLANTIYKLNEAANAINSITKQYDALDKKLITTIEDQKTMNDLLDQAADKLSNEGDEGQTDRDIYNTLEDNATRRRYLEAKEAEYRQKANEARQQQLAEFNRLSVDEKRVMLDINATSAKILQAQSALFAINNNSLYEYIDGLNNVKDGVEDVAQSILEAVSPAKALALANDSSATAIKNLVHALNNENTAILNSDTGSLREHVEAYQALQKSVEALGDSEILDAFNKVYQQWGQIATKFGASLDFLDNYGVTIDKFNEFGEALRKAGIDAQESAEKINELFRLVEAGADLGLTIRSVFADELANAGEKADELYNKILNAYSLLTTKGILNTGQNMTTFYNKINKLYEAAGKWSSMTAAEQTEFISDNAALFEGEDGAELLRALQTQNYEILERAIKNNQAMKEETAQRLKELQSELAVELAKNADQQNKGYISFLQNQIKALEDYESETTKLYRVSIELALEQENKQLDAYKDMLEKQQEALTKSLEARKDAYSKYFEEINQQYEEEEYEKQAQLLMSNIAKIGVTDAGETRKQQMELTAQLAELEEERLKTLREQAQSAVIQSIEDEVTQINEKFDKLLESNKDLLAAMTAEITGDATDFATRMLTNGMQNQTYLGAQSFLEEFQTIFGSRLSSDVLDNIRVTQDGAGNIILNVNGQTINLSDTQNNDLYEAIRRALRDIGNL